MYWHCIQPNTTTWKYAGWLSHRQTQHVEFLITMFVQCMCRQHTALCCVLDIERERWDYTTWTEHVPDYFHTDKHNALLDSNTPYSIDTVRHISYWEKKSNEISTVWRCTTWVKRKKGREINMHNTVHEQISNFQIDF